ncbi:hypothetical protein M409DRAFT_25078 [Zasmidium cellare ATCC 36951]|uniref:Uncharacterized protein n=1 Tax=Zasmidium cellare ATCC 36951 TaxID=1080233 RepID=A0A6A6CBX6_ZASCE|nr:uncharacterized protein M409DRAFT_25078 [Zasmidium cellare ATCC 36951]KAF2164684.1 hypothetical protein M409DRAFT_25078 [Zasmidium cellare ATCC 36951]
MENKNQIFPRLKPLCVALHQSALEVNGPKANINVLTQRLEDLKHALSSITSKPNALDEKIAEYVFVPLSYVLKASQRVSVRCMELTFQCLAILIDQGWKSRIQPQLAAQIVILCTLMAEKNPKGIASSESTPELQASALWCLFHTFTVLGSAENARGSLNSEENFPQLGQTISVILDALIEGGSVEAQVAATNALRSLVQHVATREVQAAFLPGIVSKLTKVLTTQSKQRRNHVVLFGSLEILQLLFRNTLDTKANNMTTSNHSNETKRIQSSVINEKWLESAATQLKPAIANIVRLKDHSRSDVREALAQVCLLILKQCRPTLEDCAGLALETVLLLSADESHESMKFRLESLIFGDPSISDLLQNTLYNWLQSLPTQIQGADDQAKVRRLQQINTAHDVLKSSGADISTLERMLGGILRDSMVVTIQDRVPREQHEASVSPLHSLDLTIVQQQHRNTEFTSSLVKHKGQQDVIDAIRQFTITVSQRSASSFAADVARSLRQSTGEVQIASFWLLLDITKATLERDPQVDALLTVSDRSPLGDSHLLEDLYSFSLEVLGDTSDDPPDDRLQALALRTLALRAQVLGKDFRHELIDALYPVLHSLATPDELLQQDSITVLNVYTASCGYGSVKDLIVENVDYLTNAVGLKLNAFDVSPQAPQVLLMMVKLAGPSLLPYLEDTIDSIFAALADFHGYPLLVELLFRVLSVVAEEGVKAPQLSITDGKHEGRVTVIDQQPISIAELAASLQDRSEKPLPAEPVDNEPHPQRPWKTIEDADRDEDQEGEEDQVTQPLDEPEKPPPAPKTYKLLLKISELTQHFLPSASPTLRASLLVLIKTTMPAIARHENSFLPLVNTLWPEITSRLDDTEPHIIGNALDVVALLCEHAGDFMRSRVLQLWPRLVEIHGQIVKDIVQSSMPTRALQSEKKQPTSTSTVSKSSHLKQAIARFRSSPADYSDTGTRQTWTSLMHTVPAIVRHVTIPADLFEEALEMMSPMLDDAKVMEAFESQNADAVWLSRVRNGTVAVPRMPMLNEGIKLGFVMVNG